jgi:Tfp pilus assembly PilM family ATPase
VDRLIHRQIAVVDPGRHVVKLLGVSQSFGQLKPTYQQRLSLKEEGLLSSDESDRQLQSMLVEGPPTPLVLLLPQELSVSQIIDIPADRGDEVRKAIEEETTNLSGLAEGGIVYDYSRLKPFGRYLNPYWVTFCRETEVQNQLQRLGEAAEHLREVTTPANALLAAFLACRFDFRSAVLVDCGAASSVVVVVVDGQGIYAANVPAGSDRVTEVIVRQRGCSEEQAEGLKQSTNLLAGTEMLDEVRAVVDRWSMEVERVVAECLEDHAELGLQRETLPLLLGGGGGMQVGLAEYLRQSRGWRVERWSNRSWDQTGAELGQWVAAWGAALQGFGLARQGASLLPRDQKQDRQWRQWWLHLQVAVWALLAVCVCLFLAGITQKIYQIREKSSLLEHTRATLRSAQEIESMARELSLAYEQLRPVVRLQKATLDTLHTLKVLDRARASQDLWYVLFADQASYFSGSTAASPATNAPSVFLSEGISTNAAMLPVTNGYVAELCFSKEGETMRTALSELVDQLKQEPLFRRVDTLSSDLRKNLVDPKLMVSNRYFALAIDLVENEFQTPSVPRDALLPGGSRDPRRFDRGPRSKTPVAAPLPTGPRKE